MKTQEQNAWAGAIWHDWARYQKSILPTEEEETHNELKKDFSEMLVAAMNF